MNPRTVVVRYSTGKVIDLADAVAVRKSLRRAYHPTYGAALMINNTLRRHKHAGLDIETALAAIEDQVTIIVSMYERQDIEDLRRPTKPTNGPLHNAAIAMGNVLTWARDGYIDDDTALSMICEYNLIILEIFEHEYKRG